MLKNKANSRFLSLSLSNRQVDNRQVDNRQVDTLGIGRFNLSRANRSQSEMVGFVLIVVIVIIMLMVFLIISLKSGPKELESVSVGNLLTSVMKQTTGCADYEPNYKSGRNLIKSCYDNDMCVTLNKRACVYMEEWIGGVLDDVLESESTVSGYIFDVDYSGEGEAEEILSLSSGECGGAVLGGQETISTSEGNILVRLKLCYT